VKRILTMSAALVLLACAQAGPATPPAPADTLAAIRALVGTAACSAPAQCQSLALGATACGSPESYLPWSSAVTDPKALARLAARYRQERTAFHTASGAVSDCRMRPDPGALCVRGSCVAPAANAASSVQ
jgi:hypothetical protein